MMRYVLILMGLFCWMGSALAETKTETFNLTTSTFTQVSTEEAVHDVRLSRHTLTFKLDDPIWHYTYNNSPIDFVGSKVTITSITLPDLATNTANLKHVPNIALLDGETGEVIATSNDAAPGTQQIQLPSVNGTHVAAIPYVYTFQTALTLDTSKTYTLRLNPNSNLTTPPLLPVFRNASSEYTDADQSFVRIDGGDAHYSPYLSFDGQMTMKRFIYELSATNDKSPHSLNKLLTDDGFSTSDDDNDDNKDTMVIVRLKEMDTVLQMDHSLTNAALVVASDTPATEWTQPTAENETEWQPAERAGTVRFLKGYTFKGPVDFRDVTGATGEIKMIRLEYEGDGAPIIPRTIWAPTTFALHCDLELSAYPDMSADAEGKTPSWFGRNPLTIPAGRSIRIVTHIDETRTKPNIAYGDATSRLALAVPSSTPHVLSHYRALIEENSGILRMVSPFEIPVKEGTTDGTTYALRLGIDNDSATAPSVQTLQSYAATEFKGSLILGYGVNNNAQYVQKSGSVTVAGEGLILGQGDAAKAKYVVQDGTFNGKVTFGEQVHDAALIVGDGEGEANSAKATVSVFKTKPDNVELNAITGTAEVIVERDGQLVLNGDLDMTPALRRRMTMNGGTLKAKGATPSYTFGTDFVNGGGLSINGNVTIDASGATPRFQKAAAEKADMKMEFENNNQVVVKDGFTPWFTAWNTGSTPSTYIETPSGSGFTVGNGVAPYTSATLPMQSDYAIALGANLTNVNTQDAVLFSIHSGNESQNVTLALLKNGNTVQVVRYVGTTPTIDASYTSNTLAENWHLFVVSVDHDIHVDVTKGEDGKEVVTKTITATKVTLYVDGVPTEGTILSPFTFSANNQGFQIGAPYNSVGYGSTATGLQVDNCYIWDRALTAGEVRALRPTLTIDALSGSGNLTIDGTVTLANIGYFKGTIQAVDPSSDEALDGGSIRINALHGITSDITFGYLGRRDTSVVADILALTHKEGLTPYRGTLSFDAEQYPIVDVSQTEELDLYARLRIQNGQTLRIRLDQFADGTILWPEQVDENNPPKLEIVEAGAYGGELIIPHLPDAVKQTMKFYYYGNNGILMEHKPGSWTITPNEDGAYDTFEWEYPNFAHNSAWIDAEFEGNSYNTGWMRVGKDNALLKGTDWNGNTNVNSWGSVMTEDKFFTDTRNPAGKGVKLCYRPYIELTDLKYPKVWSAAIRLTAPRKDNTTILALSSSCGGAYGNPNIAEGDALILATGDVDENDPTKPIPIVLYHVIDKSIKEKNVWVNDEWKVVAEATIADISEIPHVISAVCDGTTLTVYLDGGLLTKYTLPENWVGLAAGGLQVGQVLSGSSNTWPVTTLQSANPQDGGYVDYIRFYKGALTATAMAALAEEAPPIHQGVRYIRNITQEGLAAKTESNLWEDATTEPWLKQVWTNQTWTVSGSHARPSEGAEIRLFVKGDCTLQINTEKDANNGFLSANRLYSALNVLPADATSTPKLTLQPIGGDVTLENQTSHTWMTGKAGSDWKYGTIKFVGGGGDAIHPTAAHEAEAYDNPNDALGVHGQRSNVQADGQITEGNVTTSYGNTTTTKKNGNWGYKTYTQTRTVTETQTLTRTFTGGAVAAHLAPSAGVVQFSRLAGILVGGVPKGATGTEAMTRTRTQTQTRTLGTTSNKQPADDSPYWSDWSASAWSAWSNGDWETVVDSNNNTNNETTSGELVKAILELHADYTLIRGREEDEVDFVHLTGPVSGRGIVQGNSAISTGNVQAANAQVSDYVWVPQFTDGANWLMSDVTNSFYGANNPRGEVNGLLAEIRQVPGRLYLDLAQTVTDNGFSEQSWYRYGYPGASVYPTPVPAKEGDFAAAVSFQIRVPQGNTKQLTMDVKRNIATLNVEAASNVTETPTLKIDGDANKGLTIGKQLITFVRLEDIQENPALTLAGDALIHGHTTGTYAFKDRTWNRALLRDSIATLEAHGTNNVFKLDFELRNTNLVIADGAILEQQGEANHLWAKALTMGEGATFRFHAAGADSEANGVVFSENVKMTGTTATLHGYGQVDDANASAGQLNLHRCNFTAAGIEGPTDKAAVLTLNSASDEADKKERWICYTANLVDHSATGGKLGLTKIGTGIMAFRSPTPPSVTGPVRVEEGILRVGTKSFSDDALNAEQHLDAAIGHNGLHVAAGASLEPNHYANPEDVIACIPKDQTLSGTGTIGGVLRLNSSAQLENCAGMTIRKMVVDGSTLPDITVTLPTDIADRDILFHMLDDSARAEVRRRFYAKTPDGKRWDVGVDHKKGIGGHQCQSHYVVYAPGVPVPTDPTTATGNAFTDAFTTTMTRYYQGYSVSHLLSSTGYTKYVNDDSNHKLNASEIENAFRCFSNIWTFDRNEAPNTATSVYLDDEQSLLMAYEFGISRMSIRDLPTTGDTPTRYLIVEVQVKNTLKDVFGNVVGAGNVADFQLGTDLTFTCQLSNNGTNETTAITDAVEITDFDATDLTEPTESSHTAGVRVFAIPFSEARFPLGTSSLKVKAVMPETNNDSATTASY